MNYLSRVNLNLLYVLDALLQHQHVSQAAVALNLTQAAVSSSLKQLREIFDDPLFVRGQKSQLAATPFAASLRGPVREALSSSQAIFRSSHAFDSMTAESEFHIGMSDNVAFVLMPKLLSYLEKHAPKVRIIQHAVNHLDGMATFDRLNLDLLLGAFESPPDVLYTQKLFSDKPVIVADLSHPIFSQSRVTLGKIAEYDQVFVSLEGRPEKNFINDYFRDKGYDLKVNLFTPHTLIALRALSGTQLISHSIEGLVKPLSAALGLAYKAAPYKNEFPVYTVNQYWHLRSQKDPSHQWFRQLLVNLFK